MGRSVAKISAHAKGGGGNAKYIARRRGHPSDDREVREDAGREAPERGSDRDGDEDTIWGWNVPWFVADDGYGVWETEEGRSLLESRSLALSTQHMGLALPPESAEKLTADEKRENLVAHFSALADLEERLGGLSHFRLILSVGTEVSISELKAMVNAYLREHFPLCPAFVAIHDNTDHRHAHVYVHARQLDNRRVDLGQDYFRLDEGWMRVCAEQLNDPEIYRLHMTLKMETLTWKDREMKAQSEGKESQPKPDRWADHHDTLLTFRPFDDRWSGRLRAQTRVAETKVLWLEAGQAKAEDVAAAREEAGVLRERLDAATRRREKSASESKRQLPAEIITVSEARDLAVYQRAIQERSAEKQPQLIAPATASPSTQSQTKNRKPVQAALQFKETPDISDGRPESAEGKDGRGREPSIAETDRSLQRAPELGSEVPRIEGSLAPITLDRLSRTLGHELVAETRLAYLENCASAKTRKSPKEVRQLKEQLIEAREDYAGVNIKAEEYRLLLSEQHLNILPLKITADEQCILKVFSKHVPENLRERIRVELSRAHIIQDREGESADRQNDKPGLQVETIMPREGSPRALPDDEVWSMVVNLELARARAIALLAEEQDFKAKPHMWLSPTQGISLGQIEKQIVERLVQRRGVDDLNTLKTKVQLELKEERVRQPHKRTEAETEVKTLTERLEREKQTRKAAGLPMPSGRFSEEAIRELIGHAEGSRDTQLLGRVYEIERAQALEHTRSTGDSTAVRGLEERYVGLKLEAQVNQHRAESSLARAQKDSTGIMLPAKDEKGRDIATSLDAWHPGKGIKGALRKLAESREHREFREKLEATKGSYLSHLGQRVERQADYCETLRVITDNCRKLSHVYGFDTPAAPSLDLEKIKDLRDYALKQQGGVSNPWLRECARAEDLLRSGKTLTAQTRQSHDVASQLPDPAREEKIRKEIEEARAKQERMVRVPTSRPLNQGRDSNLIERNRDEQTRTRPKGGGGRSR